MKRDVDPHEETKAESIRPGKMQAGRPIGGYELIEILGEGGMGVVWKAHDPTLDREIAIKVLKRNDAPQSLRQRLQREAQAMAKLKHANVLTVYDSGTEGDRDFIAMELVEGCSLDEWVHRDPTKADIMAAVMASGRGLAAAHRAGLVHRDFKPHNILRSNDGRVLVTDFGLARGIGDDSQAETQQPDRVHAPIGPDAQTPIAGLDKTLEVSAPPVKDSPTPASRSSGGMRSDGVLHSPLTQTGVLIGTPAYMAPEQFEGSQPDPRTDQFAFCVTAWQLLTGARPYVGGSVDELRLAASEGVPANVRVDLPPGVRAILVRGLAPDAAKRWPSMDDLLAALEHANRPKRPVWLLPMVAIAFGLVIGATVVIARRTKADVVAAEDACSLGAADKELATVWSPAMHDEIWKDFATRKTGVTEEMFARIADPIGEFGKRWIASYEQTCKDKKAKQFGARIGCLLGVRDEIGPLVQVIRMGTPEQLARFDPHGILPNMAACMGSSPIAPPLIPDDKRAAFARLIANAIALRAQPDLAGAIAKLETEATVIGWQPAVPSALVIGGNAYLARGDYAKARELFNRALPGTIEANDKRMNAVAYLGILEVTLNELEDPSTEAPATELHPEITRALTYVRSSVKSAGNDPMLAGSLAMLETRAQLEHATWAKGDYLDAINFAKKAKEQHESIGDLSRAGSSAALIAEARLRDDNESSLEDAAYITRAAGDALEAKNIPAPRMLDLMRVEIDLARGEFPSAQARMYLLFGPAAPRPGEIHVGKTIDENGKALGNARVVVWNGELHGDPSRLYTDPRELPGEVVESDPDGVFKVHAGPGDVLVAEFARARSQPIVVGTGLSTLRLDESTAIVGTSSDTEIGVHAFARYTADASTWYVHAEIKKDKSFRLANLPKGITAIVGTIGPAGQGTRRLVAGPGATKVVWPRGEAIEVIARNLDVTPEATAWIFRGTPEPKTRADATALAAKATEVAWADIRPIGADNTAAGRGVYRLGDQHAVITGNLDGDVTVCVVPAPEPTSAVVCRRLKVKQTHAFEPGQRITRIGVTPIVIEK